MLMWLVLLIVQIKRKLTLVVMLLMSMNGCADVASTPWPVTDVNGCR